MRVWFMLVIYNIYIQMQLLAILFGVLVSLFFSIVVETHPVWNAEVFQSYPEIRQLRTLQWTQRRLVRTAIGKLYKTNPSTFIMSEEDDYVRRRLTDLIKNTNTYLKAKEAAYYIFKVLLRKLNRGLEFHLESQTNAFEDVMMQRQNDFKPLKSQLGLILEDLWDAIHGQRNTLDMPEFVPSFDYTLVGKTNGSFLNLMQTDQLDSIRPFDRFTDARHIMNGISISVFSFTGSFEQVLNTFQV